MGAHFTGWSYEVYRAVVGTGLQVELKTKGIRGKQRQTLVGESFSGEWPSKKWKRNRLECGMEERLNVGNVVGFLRGVLKMKTEISALGGTTPSYLSCLTPCVWLRSLSRCEVEGGLCSVDAVTRAAHSEQTELLLFSLTVLSVCDAWTPSEKSTALF